MYSQSVIQVRIDKPLKEEVGEIFSSIGLDMSTAIRMFFQRCRAVKGIPFALTAVPESPAVRMGVSKGKWDMPDDQAFAQAGIDAVQAGGSQDGCRGLQSPGGCF